MSKNIDLIKLSRVLGVKFNNIKLLEQALTHRSYSVIHNERLEFLGDSVLSLIITKELYSKYPKQQEGSLTRLRSHLVKGETLSEIAASFELGSFLLLGKGEKLSGGFSRKSTLADALEAVIGAIYLDGGIEYVEAVVLTWFESRIEKVLLEGDLKDPKTTLQEQLQSIGIPVPTYEIINITQEQDEQKFTVICCIADKEIKTEGIGRSRRAAEKVAAKLALKILQQQDEGKSDGRNN